MVGQRSFVLIALVMYDLTYEDQVVAAFVTVACNAFEMGGAVGKNG